MTFSEFFREATGCEPFDYQRRLATEVCAEGRPEVAGDQRADGCGEDRRGGARVAVESPRAGGFLRVVANRDVGDWNHSRRYQMEE